MEERKPQINVAVDGDQKERWDRAVEDDPRFTTMSDLIRLSVEREIADNNGSENSSRAKEAVHLSERIDSLEHAFSGLSNDIQELKGILQNQKPTNQNLKSEVFAALPTGEDAVPAPSEEIAQKIGGPVDTETVEKVLNDLARSTGQVESHIGTEEGDIRYRKRGE